MSSDKIAWDSTELTPLTDRLSLLLVVRLVMACIVLLASAAMPALGLRSFTVAGTGIYVAIAIAMDLIHRVLSRSGHRLFFINLMLLVDGLFVNSVLTGTGQSRSPFIFMAYAHIVSVTLLIGFRTGLKVALWHSILLLTVFYFGLAGWMPSIISGGTSNKVAGAGAQLEVAQASALWVVAIITAAFASLNERELRRRKGELTIIADLSSAVERTRHPSEILHALNQVTISKMNCSRAVSVSTQGDKVIMVDSDGSVMTSDNSGLISVGGAVAKATESGQPVLMKRLDPDYDRLLAAKLPGAVNVAVVPLVAEGETLAVLAAEWGDSHRRKVTRQMIDLLSNVAGRVALSLSNTLLLAEVQRLASIDVLTGLPNRRTFNVSIERELARASRSGEHISLLMLDIDHFKDVNDNHGHQVGDQVLAESAAGVMNACRTSDTPARYGGEEIVVIMPNCGADQAYAAAERIRKALSAANVTLKGVTASAGVATFPVHADTMQGLLQAADEALYQSKENGRDRTTISRRAVQLTVVRGS